jgi:hypothetical protein
LPHKQKEKNPFVTTSKIIKYLQIYIIMYIYLIVTNNFNIEIQHFYTGNCQTLLKVTQAPVAHTCNPGYLED